MHAAGAERESPPGLLCGQMVPAVAVGAVPPFGGGQSTVRAGLWHPVPEVHHRGRSLPLQAGVSSQLQDRMFPHLFLCLPLPQATSPLVPML